VPLVPLDHKGHPGLQAPQDQQDRRVVLELPVPLVQPVHKEARVLLAPRVLRGHLELQERQVPPDRRDLREPQELQDQLDRRVALA
jgi:hypothetical protein